MRKIGTVLLTLGLIFMVACGTSSPKDALEADIQNAKTNPQDIVEAITGDAFGAEATEALVEKILDFNYVLGEENIDGDSATIEATITTYPFGDIFASVVSTVSSQVAANPDMTADEIQTAFDDALINELDSAEKTYTKTVDVKLTKDDNVWVVQEDDDFSNALTGGLLDYANDTL